LVNWSDIAPCIPKWAETYEVKAQEQSKDYFDKLLERRKESYPGLNVSSMIKVGKQAKKIIKI
jgi:hypothetical protein